MRVLWLLGVLLVCGSMSCQANKVDWYETPVKLFDIKADTVSVKYEDDIVNDEDTIFVNIDVSAIVSRISAGLPEVMIDSLNRFIHKLAMDKFELAPGSTLKERVDAEVDSIDSYFNKWGGSHLAGVICALQVVYFDHGIMTLKLVNSACYSCNGDPHKEFYLHYSLPDLAEISEDSLFLADSNVYLYSICELAFRRDQGIADGASLWGAGYSFRGTNSNFYITDSGIVYVYNSYEIASGAYGMSKAYLSWEQLKPVIRPDGPLGWVLKEE